MVLETPPDGNDETRLVFIDGGDNKLFARHVTAAYRHRYSTAATARASVALFALSVVSSR